MDWLTISGDDRIRLFLDKTNKVQEGVNSVASLKGAVKGANKARNAEIKAAGGKPTRSEMKLDKRSNTMLERIGMTGMPTLPKQIKPQPDSRVNEERWAAPSTLPVMPRLDLAQAIRASRKQ